MATLRRVAPLALANGFKDTGGTVGKVSVYWQPRLNNTGNLSTQEEWANWASHVLSLDVRFYTSLSPPPGGTPIPANKVTRLTTTLPSSDVWSALFDAANVTVELWAGADRRNSTFRSFGELDVAEAIMTLYGDVAINSPLAPPTVAQLLARPSASGVFGGGGGSRPSSRRPRPTRSGSATSPARLPPRPRGSSTGPSRSWAATPS